MASKPRFSPGDTVQITSKVSKQKGKYGKIICYCKGRYPNICKVQIDNGPVVQFFDTNLELVRL